MAYKTEIERKENRAYYAEKMKLLRKAAKAGDGVMKLIKIPAIKNDDLRREVKSQAIFFMWAMDQKEYYKFLEKEKKKSEKKSKSSKEKKNVSN